jgi:hypothetical protein
MAELHQLAYFLLRCVPDVVRDEFVNIGVIAFGEGTEGKRPADVLFTRDWRRVRGLDPSLDTDFFEQLEKELQEWLNSDVADCSKGGNLLSRREWVLQTLLDSGSNGLQLSREYSMTVPSLDPKDLTLATRQLLRDYCEMPASKMEREATGRGFIRSRMKEEFERTGVWPVMRKAIPVSNYVMKGDPLKIDCSYRVEAGGSKEFPGLGEGTDNFVEFFHAVSLSSNVDSAKVLAYTWQPLRDGMRRIERSTAKLTAIVEDDLDRNDETLEFAMQTMQRSGVIVRQVSELPEIAEEARRALRL